MFTATSPVHWAVLATLGYLTAVSIASGSSEEGKPRQKRFLIFPRANPQRLQLIGGFGIPADIQLESITMGYVFKSVYLLPWNSSHWIPPFLDRHEFETGRRALRRRNVPPIVPLVLAPSNAEPYERYDGRWQELDREPLPAPEQATGSGASSPQHSRWLFYHMLEQLLEQKGLPGRVCVLRAICEASEATFTHTSGLIGELLHIAFTPSATEDGAGQGLHQALLYGQAEKLPATMSAKSGRSVCADVYAECALSLLGSFTDVFGADGSDGPGV
uniref:Uncharacterized protein n=1 Tax=Anopheles epiroticus TaxID=199890 RepID=A0A182PIB5_9DIPT